MRKREKNLQHLLIEIATHSTEISISSQNMLTVIHTHIYKRTLTHTHKYKSVYELLLKCKTKATETVAT